MVTCKQHVTSWQARVSQFKLRSVISLSNWHTEVKHEGPFPILPLRWPYTSYPANSAISHRKLPPELTCCPLYKPPSCQDINSTDGSVRYCKQEEQFWTTGIVAAAWHIMTFYQYKIHKNVIISVQRLWHDNSFEQLKSCVSSYESSQKLKIDRNEKKKYNKKRHMHVNQQGNWIRKFTKFYKPRIQCF